MISARHLLCPMNQGLESSESDLGLYQVLPAKLDLLACLAMDEESYKAMFGNTAVSRLKYKSFRRNVILAMADSISQETLGMLGLPSCTKQTPFAKMPCSGRLKLSANVYPCHKTISAIAFTSVFLVMSSEYGIIKPSTFLRGGFAR